MKVQILLLATILLLSCVHSNRAPVSDLKILRGTHWSAVVGERSRASQSCQKNPKCEPLVILVPSGPTGIDEAMREICREQSKNFTCVGPTLAGTLIVIERYRK